MLDLIVAVLLAVCPPDPSPYDGYRRVHVPATPHESPYADYEEVRVPAPPREMPAAGESPAAPASP